jgi:hypothetical protein
MDPYLEAWRNNHQLKIKFEIAWLVPSLQDQSAILLDIVYGATEVAFHFRKAPTLQVTSYPRSQRRR